jgi:hypothetical protein
MSVVNMTTKVDVLTTLEIGADLGRIGSLKSL